MRAALNLVAGMALLAPSTNIQAQSYGFAMYSAVIAANGATTRSSGVAASAKLNGAGTYAVAFSRPVDSCTAVASLAGGIAGHAEVFSQARESNNLRINTFNSSGSPTNLPFSVIVTCAS